jgi:hypothetical protein
MVINSCFYSSFIFLTTSLLAWYCGYVIYSILFLLLTITSVIVHSNYNIYTLIIDKISILLVVLYGGYVFYEKFCYNELDTKYCVFSFLILCTFFITIYLYVYGYYSNQYCFYENKNIAILYHSLLHIISSFGHNLIVLF